MLIECVPRKKKKEASLTTVRIGIFRWFQIILVIIFAVAAGVPTNIHMAMKTIQCFGALYNWVKCALLLWIT